VLDNKTINKQRSDEIFKKLSDPVQRKILYARMWFPFERCTIANLRNRPKETEEEWADRKIAQLEQEVIESEG